MPEAIRFDTHGRRSLLQFLNGAPQAQFAKSVGVCQQTVNDWVLGKCRPSSLMRDVLERAAKIPRDAWLLPAERRRLRAA